MKDLLNQWEKKAIIKVKKWEICDMDDDESLVITIANGMLSIEQIKMLNRLMEKNGWGFRFDNIDIYNGEINIWLN